ncbi:MAG: DUF2065 domain-containing protein [Pseudomonadota bacterium]|jgi:hypothetical protein|nr:DUF2065 domain-containing protein [Pseudomonadota bacterium]MEC8956665.1 DUF2065 domain-containing protein [Pseudomonadota bacterium]
MWHEIITTIALLLIIEGMIPFISPDSYKKFVVKMSELNDYNLRLIGLVSMIIGVLILFFKP